MSFCAVREREYKESLRRKNLRNRGFATPAIQAHDEEHTWRERGEQAIRDEMERRVVAYLAKKVKH